MALHDEILAEIVIGNIPSKFKIANLLTKPDPSVEGCYLVGSRSYSKNSISVIPANHSISPDGSEKGDYVKKGRQPVFYRLGNGWYELIRSECHEVTLTTAHGELGDMEGENESIIFDSRDATNSKSDSSDNKTYKFDKIVYDNNEPLHPAKIIVDSLTRNSYQRYFKRQKLKHPKVPANGWNERLSSYFWPSLSKTWTETEPVLQSYYNRFGELGLGSSEVNSDELSSLFKDICLWGGVKLPESDPSKLLKEVTLALRQLDNREVPTNCRINSAWTKLYAIARPDSCVIYDSRVAASLTTILDPHMNRLANSNLYEPYSALGHVIGRGGSRPRSLTWNWPNGYQRWDAQCAANKLCGAVTELLNQQAKDNGTVECWTLRKVEAVLFMDGY